MTRPLPERVQAAARELFDLTVREVTTPLTQDELRAALQEYDGVVPTLGDVFSADIAVEECKSNLLRLADMAMYVAKKTGRNRTAVAAEPVRRRTPTVQRG